jgi:hypothetical protein
MQKVLTLLLYLVIVGFAMTGCTVLQQTGPVSEEASIQNLRAASSEAALQQLQEIDTLVKLDNRWLADQIESAIVTQAASTGKFNFEKLRLDFDRQFISLTATVAANDDAGNIISMSVSGEVLLAFSGKGLEWLPRFNQLQINSTDFEFEDGSYAEPITELTEHVLANLGSEVANAIVEQRDNIIFIDTVPLGEVHVGASLPGLSDSPALQTQALRGIFMVVGSAMLIESDITTIALELSFIPDLSTCAADITVSRADFTKGVESREPVGIVRDINGAAEIQYYYSEIAGAKRPTTIIHYWFSEGQLVAVKELEVGTSERWRTWSSSGTETTDTKHLEVLVVEKDSGCILHSAALRSFEPESPVAAADQGQATQTFATLRESFHARVNGFSIFEMKPTVAQIETRRTFLGDVLQRSLADLSIEAGLDGAALSPLQFTSGLQPFETGDIICEHRKCPVPPGCKANIADCKRLRDTRDCSSCLFRNPLNNRCVSEAIDPLCEAARNRQNARYDNERASCIATAEASKLECDQLNAQALRSCQIEAGFEGSVCESIKTSMQDLENGAPLAKANASAKPTGTIGAVFSNFRIEGDLEGLKLDLTLKPNIQLNGKLSFSPANITRPLANCISAWSGSFTSKFVATPEVNNLLTQLVESGSDLSANWSGFGLSIETTPSPMQSVLVENPELLANCRIGLTVNSVEHAFAGDDADFFRGQFDLEIQPLATKIQLRPATISSGDKDYSAEPNLSARHLTFIFEG